MLEISKKQKQNKTEAILFMLPHNCNQTVMISQMRITGYWQSIQNKNRKKYTSGPIYWNVPVLVNTGTVL